MGTLAFDVAHLLAGGMLVLSFVLLYQDRISATLNIFALQAIVLSMSVAWQALIQDAPHLLATAAIALVSNVSSSLQVAIRDINMAPVFDEPRRDHCADPAAGAGHQRDLFRQA